MSISIEEMSEKYDMDMELVSKLIIAIENNKHYTRGNKVAKEFDKVVNEGWIHYQNIQHAKEGITHED